MRIDPWRMVLLICMVVLLAAGSSTARTVYVAPAGNDTWPGTFDQPFRTIGKAVSTVSAGDTILMRGGTYTLTSTISISKSGNASAVYHLMAYPGERPLLDFSSMAVSSSNRGINLSGSYWYVWGIDIKGAGDNGMYMSGSHNIVEFCSFFENRDTGLQLSGGASYNQVINCDSYYNCDTSQGNADGFSPKLDVGTGNSFYGCRSWQNSDDGFDGYLRPSDDVTTTYEKCWTFKNGYLKSGLPSSGNGNGFKMGGSDTKTLRHNAILKDCMAFDNRVKGFDQNNNMGSMTLYNCTSFNNGTNYKIDAALATGKTLTVINCDALGPYGSLGSFAVQQTNSWMPAFTVTAADFRGTDPSAAYGPRNADGSLPDIAYMHLAPGSDLIDAGSYVGLPYNGAAPDLGAFESAGPPTFVLTVIAAHGAVAKTPDAPRYDSSTVVQLTAAADSGYHFAQWSGSDVPAGHESDNPLTLVLDANKTVTATFDPNPPQFALSIAIVGAGSVQKSPDQQTYEIGTIVHLTAVPAAGFDFASWSGDIAGTFNPDSITIDTNRQVTATFVAHAETLWVHAIDGWSMISVPNLVDSYAKSDLFPTAVSQAFTYAAGYLAADSFSIGNGYWLKFPAADSIPLIGPFLREDTIALQAGWNMVGSISVPVDVSAIESVPGGLAVSDFFGYDGSYSTAAVIEPGHAYWVRSPQIARIVLSSQARTVAAAEGTARIRIHHGEELPPPPPGKQGEISAPGIPTSYALGRNFPNPFNPSTNFRIAIPASSTVDVAVFDLLGRRIAVLMEGMKAPGYYSLSWDGRTMGGSAAGSGVYIIRMAADRFVGTQKILLMK